MCFKVELLAENKQDLFVNEQKSHNHTFLLISLKLIYLPHTHTNAHTHTHTTVKLYNYWLLVHGNS